MKLYCRYHKPEGNVEAELVFNGKEVAWLKKSYLIDNGHTLLVGHFGVTKTQLNKGFAKQFFKLLKSQHQHFKKTKEIIFTGIDLSKDHWAPFLKRFNAVNIGKKEFLQVGLIKGQMLYDSFIVQYSDIEDA